MAPIKIDGFFEQAGLYAVDGYKPMTDIRYPELVETPVFTRQVLAAMEDDELLILYPKNERSDLTRTQLLILRKLVNDAVFED